MSKHIKKSLEEKIKIVKEFKSGVSIPYLNKKYKISSTATISIWNKKYDKGTLNIDNRGKKLSDKEIDDIDILKKSYALLTEICNKQHK